MDLNKVSLIGRLTRDPESKSISTGSQIVKFGLATNRTYKVKSEKKEETVFHNIIAWGKLGEIISKFLKKGDKVYIDGRVNNRSFQDKSGVKKYYSEIVANNMIMLGGNSNKKKTVKELQADEVQSEVVEEEVDVEKIPF